MLESGLGNGELRARGDLGDEELWPRGLLANGELRGRKGVVWQMEGSALGRGCLAGGALSVNRFTRLGSPI